MSGSSRITWIRDLDFYMRRAGKFFGLFQRLHRSAAFRLRRAGGLIQS